MDKRTWVPTFPFLQQNNNSPSDGRAWVYNGELYFSPNSKRDISIPPQERDRVTFTPGISRASEFQTPRWWSADSEWLGFVPIKPVAYTGVFLEALSHLPRKIRQSSLQGFCIPPPLAGQWMVIENMLIWVAHYLRQTNNLTCLRPPNPSEWKYHLEHEREEVALRHALEGRDWFAMWIGLTFWILRKIPENANFVEGLQPPVWLIQLATHRKDQALLDSVRTSPLLHRYWNVERVGLWLGFDNNSLGQPPVQWFVEQGVPVWYRWSHSERSTSSGLIAPTSEQLQAATTWITPVPAHAPNSPLPFFNETPEFDPFPGDLGPFEDNPVPETSSSVALKSGRSVWEPFLREREVAHERKRAKESAVERQRRENRAKNPPLVSAPVYVWDWDFNDPTKFTRTLVPRSEREDTLLEYSLEQRRYDPYYNEWDCCLEWGPDCNDSDSDVETKRPTLDALSSGQLPDSQEEGSNPSMFRPLEHEYNSPEGKAERGRLEIMEVLSQHYGFVPPLPLPSTVQSPVSQAHRKILLSTLYIETISTDCLFFDTPLGELATRFVVSFVENTKPNPDFWDLATSCHGVLQFNKRLSAIRRVRNDKATMYMFDFGSSATVSWNLATYTAAATLFICRLDDSLEEEEIALELVQVGVPFRTLQRRDTLPRAAPERPLSTFLPMRISDPYIFGEEDYKAYLKQCHYILMQKRSRAALLRGGFLWRIALAHIGVSNAIRGPTGTQDCMAQMFSVKDDSGVEYIDDELTPDEVESLSGMYLVFKGRQMMKLSWFPLQYVFEGSGEDAGRWTPHVARIYDKRNDSIHQNFTPIGAGKWRDYLRGQNNARRANKCLEKWSKEFLEEHL